MSIQTYDDLIGAIPDWLARDDDALLSRVADFIALAEARMQRDLDTTEAEITATITGVDGQTEYPLPSDFKIARALRGNDASNSYALNYFPPGQFDNCQQTSPPVYNYTVRGQNIVFHISPGDGVELYLDYVARFAPITPSNQQNWILTYFPDAYLSASLAEASAYDRDDAGIIRWTGRYEGELATMRKYLAEQRYAATPLVIRAG